MEGTRPDRMRLLLVVALFGVMTAERERIRAEAAMRQAQMALADAQRAANPGQSR